MDGTTNELTNGRVVEIPKGTFWDQNMNTNQVVNVRIESNGFGSMCSHHFLPYFVTQDKNSYIEIKYLPKRKIIGLSKIPRIVEWCMKRPSTQEKMTLFINETLQKILETDSVYVRMNDIAHTCALLRGISKEIMMTTELGTGFFKIQGMEPKSGEQIFHTSPIR